MQREIAVSCGIRRRGLDAHDPWVELPQNRCELAESAGNMGDAISSIGKATLNGTKESTAIGNAGVHEHAVEAKEQGATELEVFPVISIAQGVQESRGIGRSQSESDGVDPAHERGCIIEGKRLGSHHYSLAHFDDYVGRKISMVGGTMRIDIWSDVACPWCYIGKRELERALTLFDNDIATEIVWHSFELDPNAPEERMGTLESLIAKKYQMSEEQARSANVRLTTIAANLGLTYNLDRVRVSNTFTAHRLVHYAATEGCGDEMKEALFAAYFTDGRLVSDHDVLADIAQNLGLDREETMMVLTTDAFADAVRHDEMTAQQLGFTSVPTFVFDRRMVAIGAQDASVIGDIIAQAMAEADHGNSGAQGRP
jgi:predicted DsbA family dithiol-disulfide isomerase